MASIFTVANEQATLSATFRSFFEVYNPCLATIDLDIVNYSTLAISRRQLAQDYWSRFDGDSQMISVYTRDTDVGEEAMCELSSVRDRPRYPSSRCQKLANLDNAILGHGANYLARVAYLMEHFPPPFLTADLVFIPSTASTHELVTILIIDPSISLVADIDAPRFSHPLMEQSRIIIKKEVTRRIGAGTLFAFVKFKEITHAVEVDNAAVPVTENLYSSSGRSFMVDIKFSQRIRNLYGDIFPDELLDLVTVLSYQKFDPRNTAPPFEVYLWRKRQGPLATLMSEIILGSFSPLQIWKLCQILGNAVNQEEELGPNGLGVLLGFNPLL